MAEINRGGAIEIEINLSPMAKLVRAGAQQLFGEERWQSPLAHMLWVTPTYIAHIAAGRNKVPDELARQIAHALIAEAAARRKAANKVDKIAARILQKLDGE